MWYPFVWRTFPALGGFEGQLALAAVEGHGGCHQTISMAAVHVLAHVFHCNTNVCHYSFKNNCLKREKKSSQKMILHVQRLNWSALEGLARTFGNGSMNGSQGSNEIENHQGRGQKLIGPGGQGLDGLLHYVRFTFSSHEWIELSRHPINSYTVTWDVPMAGEGQNIDLNKIIFRETFPDGWPCGWENFLVLRYILPEVNSCRREVI